MIDRKEIQLPASWEKCTLESIVRLNPTLDKSLLDDSMDVSFVPMPAVEAETGRIDVSQTRKLVEVKKGYTAFKERDVLFAKITPCMENGKMAIAPKLTGGIGFGSTEFHVLRCYDDISPDYIYYFVSSKQLRMDAEHNMTGAVGQKRVPTPWLTQVEVPLPPLNEQHRIVVKIEELFSELDKAVECLKTAREQLKVYRQALLKHAFEGKLTEQWRRDNADKLESADALLARIQHEREARYEQQIAEWNEAVKRWEAEGRVGKKPGKPREFDSPEMLLAEEQGALAKLPRGWKWSRLGQVFGVYVGSTPSRKRSDFWSGTIPWVSSGEVSFCHINDTREKITELGFESASTALHPVGTVMLAMIGEGKTRGQAAILDIEAAHNQNTAAIRVSETECIPTLVYYYFLYEYESTRKLGSGNNQKALSKDRVSRMCFPLPPVREQEQIVRMIEEIITRLGSVDVEITDNLQRNEALRQSILKKAFSGQLVPQDPDDEPAGALLARIAAEKASRTLEKGTKGTRPRGKAIR